MLSEVFNATHYHLNGIQLLRRDCVAVNLQYKVRIVDTIYYKF